MPVRSTDSVLCVDCGVNTSPGSPNRKEAELDFVFHGRSHFTLSDEAEVYTVKDENPADTAVREVKEETGLRVTAGEVIGERVHPKTHRTMIYLAARPTHGTDVFVGDEDELAEVRWVSLAEADELLPGMFGPVREHLARELGEA